MTQLITALLLTAHLETEVQFPLVLAKTAYETYLVRVPTAYKNTSSYFPLIHFIKAKFSTSPGAWQLTCF